MDPPLFRSAGQIQEIRSILQQKEDENDHLRSELSRIKDDFLFNLNLLSQRDSELEQYESRFEILRKSYSELEAEKKDQQREISNLKKELAETQNSHNKESSEWKNREFLFKNKLLNETSTQGSALQSKLSQVETERNIISQKLAMVESSLLQEREQFRREKERAESSLQEQYQQKIEEAEKARSILQADKSALQLAHDQLKRSHEEQSQILEQLTGELQEEKRKRKKAEWDRDDAIVHNKTEAQSQSETVQQLKAVEYQTRSELEQWKQNYSVLLRENEQLRREGVLLHKAKDESERKLSQITEDRNALLNRLSERVYDNEQARQREAKLEAELNEAKEANGRLRVSIFERKEENGHRTKEVEQMEREIERILEEKQQVEELLVEKKEKLKEYRNVGKAVSILKEEHHVSVEALSRMLDELRVHTSLLMVECQAKIDDSQTRMTSLENELETAHAERTELENDFKREVTAMTERVTEMIEHMELVEEERDEWKMRARQLGDTGELSLSRTRLSKSIRDRPRSPQSVSLGGTRRSTERGDGGRLRESLGSTKKESLSLTEGAIEEVNRLLSEHAVPMLEMIEERREKERQDEEREKAKKEVELAVKKEREKMLEETKQLKRTLLEMQHNADSLHLQFCLMESAKRESDEQLAQLMKERENWMKEQNEAPTTLAFQDLQTERDNLVSLTDILTAALAKAPQPLQNEAHRQINLRIVCSFGFVHV
ncbi:hypothetical protein BLNAU_2814 [Blattamonas nauphoetae]|uniref:Uncharacterized protein n=1 Tax=Blattamonas nauphoetae TaxID=2049346 RepID=A0ABQ9YEL9_9EUKA|nr:hypothetical protein BLNAU_2814 [Blattamonas nauphoetae]